MLRAYASSCARPRGWSGLPLWYGCGLVTWGRERRCAARVPGPAPALDVRATVRSLRQRPAYTVTAVLALGLGIGATTTVFSVVQSTVLRALRVPDVDRVVALWSEFAHSADAEFLLSAAELNDVRTEVRLLDLTGAWFGGETALDARGGVEARTVSLANIIGDVYALTGARVVLGRLPGAADDVPGAELVAVLSNGFWWQAYGQDPDVVGGTIPIGSASARINIPVEMPGTMHDVVRVSAARERMIATLIGGFAIMATIMAAVGVFGVVSFTVAQRAREFAIRSALGATRGTVLRDVLRSNAFIASTGAVAGALAVWSAAPTLREFLYHFAPRNALVFTGVPAARVAVALLSSLLPALRATRVSPADALNAAD